MPNQTDRRDKMNIIKGVSLTEHRPDQKRNKISIINITSSKLSFNTRVMIELEIGYDPGSKRKDREKSRVIKENLHCHPVYAKVFYSVRKGIIGIKLTHDKIESSGMVKLIPGAFAINILSVLNKFKMNNLPRVCPFKRMKKGVYWSKHHPRIQWIYVVWGDEWPEIKGLEL